MIFGKFSHDLPWGSDCHLVRVSIHAVGQDGHLIIDRLLFWLLGLRIVSYEEHERHIMFLLPPGNINLIFKQRIEKHSVGLGVFCHFEQELLTFLEMSPSPLPVIINLHQFLPCPVHEICYWNGLYLLPYKPLEIGHTCWTIDEVLLKYFTFILESSVACFVALFMGIQRLVGSWYRYSFM